jgi:hypothetical protein
MTMAYIADIEAGDQIHIFFSIGAIKVDTFSLNYFQPI